MSGSARLMGLFEELVWIAKLNFMFLALTFLGGVIFGIGPALLAGFTVARDHHEHPGTVAPVAGAMWRAFRHHLVPGNALGLPLQFAMAMIFIDWRLVQGGAAGVAVAVVGVLFVATVCVLLPMFAHYDLPLARYLPKAAGFALRNAPSTVILLLPLSALIFVSYLLPGLLLVVSFGAWIYTDSYLAGRFFAHNEVRLAAQTAR